MRCDLVCLQAQQVVSDQTQRNANCGLDFFSSIFLKELRSNYARQGDKDRMRALYRNCFKSFMRIKRTAKDGVVDLLIPQKVFNFWITSFEKTKRKIRNRLGMELEDIHETYHKRFRLEDHSKQRISKGCRFTILRIINKYGDVIVNGDAKTKVNNELFERHFGETFLHVVQKYLESPFELETKINIILDEKLCEFNSTERRPTPTQNREPTIADATNLRGILEG